MDTLRKILAFELLEHAYYNIFNKSDICYCISSSNERSHDHGRFSEIKINQLSLYDNENFTTRPLIVINSNLEVNFSEEITEKQAELFQNYFKGLGIELKQ